MLFARPAGSSATSGSGPGKVGEGVHGAVAAREHDAPGAGRFDGSGKLIDIARDGDGDPPGPGPLEHGLRPRAHGARVGHAAGAPVDHHDQAAMADTATERDHSSRGTAKAAHRPAATEDQVHRPAS
jgi:hypothetical protein